MEGSSTDCAYDQAVAHLRCLSKRAFESLEVVDPDGHPDHISVTAESLVVVDLGDDDNMSVITDVDHISVITEVPDLGDVEEDDGLVPRFRSIPPLIPPPTPKKRPRMPIGQGQSKAKAPQPPKTPPPKWLMGKVDARAPGVDAGTTSDHPTDHASDSSRAADAAAMPPPPPPPPKTRRAYGDAASSADDAAYPPPPEPFGEGPPRRRATVRQTISDPCDVDMCGRMREADECRHCAVHCADMDCPVHWSFPQRCAMSDPVWCKHKHPHPSTSDCCYCRKHCQDPDCAYHNVPAKLSTTRT